MSNILVNLLTALAVSCVASASASGKAPINCSVISAANISEVIQCPLTTGGFTWFKDGAKLLTVNDKFTVDAENGTLVIEKIGEPYIGEYVCMNSIGLNATITVCSVPYVRQYDKAKNIIEGDPFQAECSAWGFPAVTVSWYRIGLPLTNDGGRISFKNGSVENSTIRVEKMTYDDSADYECVVTNSAGVANATITVDIKNKYAALWPFLGICVEVFVLCLIIILYERRHLKQLTKEAAQCDETDFMTVNNGTKGTDEVRHRK